MSKPFRETVTEGNLRVFIVVEPGDDGWRLMIVNDDDEATQWEDTFRTRDEALQEGRAAIAEQGVAFFAQSLNDYGG